MGRHVGAAADVMLQSLTIFDARFCQRWACDWHPYLLGDDSLLRLLSATDPTVDPDDIHSALALCSVIGLVYRFEAAPRYRCAPGLSQLRASGWGRAHIGQAAGRDRCERIDSLVRDPSYGELVQFLSSVRDTSSWASDIAAINGRLPVRVVA